MHAFTRLIQPEVPKATVEVGKSVYYTYKIGRWITQYERKTRTSCKWEMCKYILTQKAKVLRMKSKKGNLLEHNLGRAAGWSAGKWQMNVSNMKSNNYNNTRTLQVCRYVFIYVVVVVVEKTKTKRRNKVKAAKTVIIVRRRRMK